MIGALGPFGRGDLSDARFASPRRWYTQRMYISIDGGKEGRPQSRRASQRLFIRLGGVPTSCDYSDSHVSTAVLTTHDRARMVLDGRPSHTKERMVSKECFDRHVVSPITLRVRVSLGGNACDTLAKAL